MTTFTLAYRNSPLHAAVAAAVARVLEAYEIEPDLIAGDDVSLARMMAAGEIDLFATAWLPERDRQFLSPAVETLGTLYRPAFGFFAAPTVDEGVTSLEGLMHGTVARNLITPESLVPLVRQVVAAYHLTEAGFTIDAQPDEQAHATAAAAIAAGEPVVLPLFTPNHLIHAHMLRQLANPKNSSAVELEARMLINRETRQRVDSDMIDELDELTLGNKVVSALDNAVRHLGMSPDEAAEEWQRGKLLPR